MNHDIAEVNSSKPPMLPGSFLYEKEPGYEASDGASVEITWCLSLKAATFTLFDPTCHCPICCRSNNIDGSLLPVYDQLGGDLDHAWNLLQISLLEPLESFLGDLMFSLCSSFPPCISHPAHERDSSASIQVNTTTVLNETSLVHGSDNSLSSN